MHILEMKNISKAFGGAKALSGVSLAIEQGEIHALLGENGAGKSTLMNILAGVLDRDEGTITFDGQSYANPTIKQMEDAGIAFVHQELNVVNDLTVSENIFLHRELVHGFQILKRKEMIAETEKLFEDLGVNIDPTAEVSELKTSEKQLLEICRALYTQAKLIILDEPTTALSNEEISHLFGILKKLRDGGKSFIFISHKMPEIFDLADSYTVLRNGTFISTGKIEDTTPHAVTCDMVGEQYVDKDTYAAHELGDPVLTLKGFSGPGFKGVDLTVRKGEIVALTGLAGSGASELMQTMFGVLPSTGGSISIHGQRVHGRIKTFMKAKVAMLPGNRKENSVIPDQTVLENTYISAHSLTKRHQIIKRKDELEKYEKLKESLRIKAHTPDLPITSLSGGNQQKVFLARWLSTEADILLLDNPTQGVDVGAKEEIYELILALARSGKTVIINTLEIPEIMKVSDRCVVLYAGQVIGIFDHDDINERDVMLYSTGAINAVGEK